MQECYDFERFQRFLGDFGRFCAIFRLPLPSPRGSAIAGRVTTANVDNMLSAEPSKCWNMLNVDWTCKCCVPHVEHFARRLAPSPHPIYKTRAVWFHGFARDLNVKHEIKTLS